MAWGGAPRAPAKVADVRLKACADQLGTPVTSSSFFNHRDQLPSSVPDVDVNIKLVFSVLCSRTLSLCVCALLASIIFNGSIACLESGTTIGFLGLCLRCRSARVSLRWSDGIIQVFASQFNCDHVAFYAADILAPIRSINLAHIPRLSSRNGNIAANSVSSRTLCLGGAWFGFSRSKSPTTKSRFLAQRRIGFRYATARAASKGFL